MLKSTQFNIHTALLEAYRVLAPWSDAYRSDFRRFEKSLEILHKRGLIKNKQILDIGSGIGIMVYALNLLGGQAKGIDRFIFGHQENNFYALENIDNLKNIWSKHGIIILDEDILATKILEDNSLDLVISDALIEHLTESPKRLFLRIHNILRSGGYGLITTPNVATLHKRLRFLILGRSPNWDLKDYFDRSVNFLGHRREFAPPELVSMAKWSGFSAAEALTANVFFNPARLLTRKFLPHFLALISWPFWQTRENIYLLIKK